MIFDLISSSQKYSCIIPGLKDVFLKIPLVLNNQPPPGRYIIHGDQLFYSVSEYITKPVEDCRLETHRKYCDVQMLIYGNEKIGYCLHENVLPDIPYNEATDLAFYKGDPCFLTLSPGAFAVFFPGEPHMPCVMNSSPEKVKKIVFKIQW